MAVKGSTMNGVDYNKNAVKEREYLKETVSKVNKAADKKVNDLAERNEKAEAKLRENHIRDRAQLEKNYAKNIDGLKEKTSQTLDNRSGKYNENMEKQRADFENESINKRNDFDQRLNDIKTSYKKSFDSERQTHAELEANQKNRYQKNVTDLTQKQDSKLKDYSNRVKDAGAGLKEQYSNERQQLVRAQEDQVTGVYKQERKKQNDLEHRIRHEIESTKQASEADKAHSKNYTEAKLGEMQKTYQDRTTNMAADYSQRNQQLAEKQNSQALQTNRDNQKKLTEVESNYNKSLRAIDNDLRRRDGDSSDFKDVMQKQQGLSAEAQQENKIKQLQHRLVQEKNHFNELMNQEQDKYQEDMKTQGAVFGADLKKKENAANSEKLVTITHEREKAQKSVEMRQKQNFVEKQNFDHNMAQEKKISHAKLNTLKQHFGNSMTALEEKLKTSMADLNRVNKNDKDEFVKKSSEKHIKDMFDLRLDLSRTMDATVESYESRINNLQRDNDKLRNTMEAKISDMIAYTDNKLEIQNKMYRESREAELNGFKMATDEREAARKGDTNTIIVNFQKKLDKVQTENESRIKLLTNDYENKLKDLRVHSSKELGMKEAQFKMERENLKKTLDEQKKNLIATFEQNIESLKAGHEEQMNQMKNYNKLS